MTDWKAVYESRCKELEELTAQYEENQKTNEQLDKQLISQLDALTAKAERLQVRLTDLTKMVKSKNIEVQNEVTGEGKLLEDIKTLESRCNALKRKKEKLSQDKKKLDDARIQVSKENMELEEKLEDIEEDNVV